MAIHLPSLRGLCIGLLLAAVSAPVPESPAAAPVVERPTDAAGEQADLRPALAAFGLEPRVQGSRGTCSAFVVTQALEFAVSRQREAGVRLSVEYLNWAANQVTGEPVDGGFFSDLWKGFAAYGVCGENDMPYQSHFDAAARPADRAIESARPLLEAGLRLHWIKPWDASTGLTEAHLAEIKRTLSMGWPVCAGLRWPKAEVWNERVLQMAPPEGVRDGHSVLLVGFRDDASLPGGGVFIFRNSAGPSREALMTYEYAAAYMNDAVWIAGDVAERAPGDGVAPESAPFPGFLSPMSPAPEGRNRRVSSNQQPDWHSENLDMTWLQPGESVEMPLLQGPGIITHMWFTSHAGWANELNALSLRVYWDGSTDPGIEAPLGDFFAVGQGKPAPVESIPVQVSSTGSLSCYWRMPFEKSARIVVTNDNPDRGAGVYWQVDWTQVPQLPPGTPRFFARYRHEYPAGKGRDYLFADLRGRGRYIGGVLSVTLAQDGWFGEGDDFFYIDGEEVPSLQGTGSEDYFNDAWGFRPRTSHWFGSPRWQGDAAGDSGVCYRWHLPDAVNFEQSLKVVIEHKGNHAEDTQGFFVERPDFLSSVAFWYQTGEPAASSRLPAWAERRIPWLNHNFVRDFRIAEPTGGAPVKVDTSGLFGARPVLLWPNTKPGAVLTFPFDVPEDGSYAVRLTAAGAPDYGRYDLEIDGRKVATGNFRVPEPTELDVPLGTHALSKGDHTITFRARDGVEQGGPMAIEMLRLLKLPPQAKREVKTHHEAHFVRLAIGRAVYAYRLAYDQLPSSLDELVKSGILASRYLNDENDVPLRSRREGEFFVVESTQGEVWTRRWQGLDARR